MHRDAHGRHPGHRGLPRRGVCAGGARCDAVFQRCDRGARRGRHFVQDTPLQQFEKTYLADYAAPAFANAPPGIDFWTDITNAFAGRWPHAVAGLLSALVSLDRFIGVAEIATSQIQGELAIGSLWFMAVGKRLQYAEFQACVEAATAFQDADPADLADLSFELNRHYGAIFDMADDVAPMKQKKQKKQDKPKKREFTTVMVRQ
jgi:hypothetical protein